MDTILNKDFTYRSASQINEAMGRVYGHMGIAVLISMLVSFWVGNTPELLEFFFTGIMKWITVFAPLVFIILTPVVFNAGINKLGATLMLDVFAALMGLSFSTIFAVYSLGSVVEAFMGSAILFGTMSFYGYFTKKSLDSIGQFLIVGLIAILIASIINIFIGSTIAQMVISALAIIIFLGLTAYDTQKIREELMDNTERNAEIYGALTLYLDFINIFLNLLSILGDRK